MVAADASNYFRDLYELGADSSLTLMEKVERAINVGRDRLGVDYGVLSYTGDGEYEIVDSTFADGDYVAGSVHDLEATWCRHVVGDQELLAIADAGDSEYSDDVARDISGLQCYIGAPILVDGETYGTLCYSGEEPRASAFTEDDERFVQLLTRWIGHQLEQQRHYETLDRQNERLNEFAGVLAHDLRSPLTAARGYTELVTESTDGENAAHLQTVLESLDRMEELISETLALAREGADVGKREPVELEAVARDAWATVAPETATLRVENARAILADRSRLRQLLENLFRNVVDHCGDETTVIVRGTEDGFEVADDGPGLPDSVSASLFGGDFGANRLGLGLLIVERVVSGHGWQGTVDTSDGTRFSFAGVGAVVDPPAVD